MSNVAPEVQTFLARCSNLIEQNACYSFSYNTWREYTELKMESPIEHLFYTALKSLAILSSTPLNDVISYKGETIAVGLYIVPQVIIGTYRVDFLIMGDGHPDSGKDSRRVIVECDSQLWHERTEQERRAEKRRDRDLLRQGYHVFRFTGREIMDDPFCVGLEVLQYVTGSDMKDTVAQIYDLEVSD